MSIKGLLGISIILMIVSGCSRLADEPTQYSALNPVDQSIDESYQNDNKTQSTKQRPVRSPIAKRQDPSFVEPSAVLEASIVARRNWKSRNLTDLENMRPAIAIGRPTDKTATGSLKQSAPLAQ